ncbi:hypothetical protein PR048_002487 [Dryococelus australis]|uniref:Uncharacterized protein n=1 Tax=Dryococelus australis TaxID=614101 RepID=A0ABQ9ILD4_9NEOP|nr:hypothetical protein PR048_002487 [Dryococelus australis]
MGVIITVTPLFQESADYFSTAEACHKFPKGMTCTTPLMKCDNISRRVWDVKRRRRGRRESGIHIHVDLLSAEARSATLCRLGGVPSSNALEREREREREKGRKRHNERREESDPQKFIIFPGAGEVDFVTKVDLGSGEKTELGFGTWLSSELWPPSLIPDFCYSGHPNAILDSQHPTLSFRSPNDHLGSNGEAQCKPVGINLHARYQRKSHICRPLHDYAQKDVISHGYFVDVIYEVPGSKPDRQGWQLEAKRPSQAEGSSFRFWRLAILVECCTLTAVYEGDDMLVKAVSDIDVVVVGIQLMMEKVIKHIAGMPLELEVGLQYPRILFEAFQIIPVQEHRTGNQRVVGSKLHGYQQFFEQTCSEMSVHNTEGPSLLCARIQHFMSVPLAAINATQMDATSAPLQATSESTHKVAASIPTLLAVNSRSWHQHILEGLETRRNYRKQERKRRPEILRENQALEQAREKSMRETVPFFGDRVVSKVLLPPKSPDRTPSDFFLLDMLEGTGFDKPRTITELQGNVRREIDAVAPYVLVGFLVTLKGGCRHALKLMLITSNTYCDATMLLIYQEMIAQLTLKSLYYFAYWHGTVGPEQRVQATIFQPTRQELADLSLPAAAEAINLVAGCFIKGAISSSPSASCQLPYLVP